jgi:hypothetical protein
VEWLGDTAANVIFDDAGAAKRALEATSAPLPPLAEVVEGKEEGREGGKEEEEEESMEVGYRPGEGPVGWERRKERGREGGKEWVDLPEYGWRVGVKRILKGKDDAYGLKGTAVRVLLRIATTADVLREKAKGGREGGNDGEEGGKGRGLGGAIRKEKGKKRRREEGVSRADREEVWKRDRGGEEEGTRRGGRAIRARQGVSREERSGEGGGGGREERDEREEREEDEGKYRWRGRDQDLESDEGGEGGEGEEGEGEGGGLVEEDFEAAIETALFDEGEGGVEGTEGGMEGGMEGGIEEGVLGMEE